jgi:hypothetical protein
MNEHPLSCLMSAHSRILAVITNAQCFHGILQGLHTAVKRKFPECSWWVSPCCMATPVHVWPTLFGSCCAPYTEGTGPSLIQPKLVTLIVFGQMRWCPAAAWVVLCRENQVAAGSMWCLPRCLLLLMVSTPSLRTIFKCVSFEQALYIANQKHTILLLHKKGSENGVLKESNLHRM